MTGRVRLVNAVAATAPDAAAATASRLRIGTVATAIDVDGNIGVIVDEDSVTTAFALGPPPAVGQPVVCLADRGSWVAFGTAAGSGFTGGVVPNLTTFLDSVDAGNFTDTASAFRVKALVSPDQFEARYYVMSGGALALALLKNGVEVNRFRINNDGSLAWGPTGGRITPLPFGHWAGVVTVPAIAAGGFSQVAANFPAGRFTQPPIVVVTALNSNVLASVNNITTTGCQVFGREYQAGSSGGSAVNVIATQMLPTAASG